MLVIILAGLMTATAPAAAQPPAKAAAAAAAKPAPPPRPASHLAVARLRATANDLPGFRVVDRRSGLTFAVYHEPAAEALAASHLAYLADILAKLARAASVDPSAVHWASVVFTSDADYVPPRVGAEVRWTAPTSAAGALTPEGERFLFEVLPHEQVHALQNSVSGRLPRWYEEGQASYLGLRVAAARRPDLVVQHRRSVAAALAAATTPVRLSAWGGVQVPREAIYRQASAAERARMDADATYVPPGPYRLTPADFLSDESNLQARYGASLAIFEDMEKAAGAARVKAWMTAVWAEPTPPSTERIVQLARQHLGQDLAPRLK